MIAPPRLGGQGWVEECLFMVGDEVWLRGLYYAMTIQQGAPMTGLLFPQVKVSTKTTVCRQYRSVTAGLQWWASTGVMSDDAV